MKHAQIMNIPAFNIVKVSKAIKSDISAMDFDITNKIIAPKLVNMGHGRNIVTIKPEYVQKSLNQASFYHPYSANDFSTGYYEEATGKVIVSVRKKIETLKDLFDVIFKKDSVKKATAESSKPFDIYTTALDLLG